MPTPITRYKCQFCKKHYSTSYDTAKHEKKCFSNPVNKSCSTCNNAFYSDSTCLKYNKLIYVPGCGIKNCEGWEAIQYEEYESFDDV